MLRSIGLFLICIMFFNYADAQSKKNKSTSVKGFKPPKLTTWLGEYRDTVKLSLTEAERILAMPLRINDNAGVVYTISSFQFIYRKKNMVEDEETGKVSNTTSAIAKLFKTTPLPEMWVNTVRDQLHSGEDLYFFDIIAKDPSGRIMYAPNLKIIVQ